MERGTSARGIAGWIVGLFLLTISPTDAGAAIFLDFEGLQDFEHVLDFYNGGTGSMGSSGPNLGVGFSPSGRGLIDSDAGGSGVFIANEPSPDTVLTTVVSSLVMNVPGGFDTELSFFFSANAFDTSVDVYDGLNATGNLLASVDLAAQGTVDDGCQLPGDPNGLYNCWDFVAVNFPATARSVEFQGVAGFVAYDDITLPSPIVPPVPGLGGEGLLALAATLIGSALVLRRWSTEIGKPVLP